VKVDEKVIEELEKKVVRPAEEEAMPKKGPLPTKKKEVVDEDKKRKKVKPRGRSKK